METVNININGKDYSVKKGISVLQAAKDAGIYIPTLCAHPNLEPDSSCRLCIVQIEGQRGVSVSCSTTVANGMSIKTNSENIIELRKGILELLLLQHPSACLMCERNDKCLPVDIDMHDVLFTDRCVSCFKNLDCELQRVVDYVGLKKIELETVRKEFPVITDNPIFDIDYNLCILCGRCIRACKDLMGIGVIDYANRGNRTVVSTAFGRPHIDSGCKYCGACVEVCPTGSLMFKKYKFSDKSKEEIPVACINACPAEINVPKFLSLIKNGKYEDAFNVLMEKSPFPETLGRVCKAPCEKDCWRGDINDAIAIRTLERFLSENYYVKNDNKTNDKTNKKIGVIGSGPAGLTAAYFLAKKGYDITVFELEAKAGGHLRTGFSPKELPEEILDKEINGIINCGVKIKTGTSAEANDLLDSGFDAVIVSDNSCNCQLKKPAFMILDADGADIDIIDAVANGRKAATDIDKYFGGAGLTDDECCQEVDFKLGMEMDFAHRKRLIENDSIDIEQALYEASRCLRCDLRHNIASVNAPAGGNNYE